MSNPSRNEIEENEVFSVGCEFSGSAIRLLDKLKDSGLYGRNHSEVIERLVTQKLIEMKTSGVFNGKDFK